MVSSSMMLWGILESINNGLGRFFYGLFGGLFIQIIDTIQEIFRSIAGLEGGLTVDGVATGVDGESFDVVYYLLGSDIIQEIFFSMIIFSFFLLILMTVLSLIRNQYQDKQKAPTAILGKMFTSMISTVIFTSFVILGVMFSNVVLQMVDKGTSFGNSSKVSTTLFMAMAYNANKLRIDDGLDGDDLTEALTEARTSLDDICKKTNFASINSRTQSLCAGEMRYRLNADELNELADIMDTAFCQGQIKRGSKVLSPHNTWQTETMYNLWDCNYLIVIVGGCFIISILVKMSWGLIGRLFKLCFNFVLIPVVHAMIPFDEGASVKNLKTDIVKNITMAYVPVASLNLYFSILPVIEKIQFNWGIGFASYLFSIALSLIGLYSMQSITQTVTGWFGTGNVLSEGDATFKTLKDGVKGTFGKAGELVQSGVKTVGAYQGAHKAAKDAGSKNAFLRGVQGAFYSTKFGQGVDKYNIYKGINEGRGAGKNNFTDHFTASFSQKKVQERQGILELAKRRKDMKDQLEQLAIIYGAGTPEYNKAAEQLLLNNPLLEALESTGGKIKIGGKPVTIAAAKQSINTQDAVVKEVTNDKDEIKSVTDAIKAWNNLRTQAIAAGVDSTNLGAYMTGKSDLDTAGLDNEAVELAQEVKRSYGEISGKTAGMFTALLSQERTKDSAIIGDVLTALGKSPTAELKDLIDDEGKLIGLESGKIIGAAKELGDALTQAKKNITAETDELEKKQTEVKDALYGLAETALVKDEKELKSSGYQDDVIKALTKK